MVQVFVNIDQAADHESRISTYYTSLDDARHLRGPNHAEVVRLTVDEAVDVDSLVEVRTQQTVFLSLDPNAETGAVGEPGRRRNASPEPG